MSDHKSPEPVDTNLLEDMGYERADVNVRTLSKSAIVFFVASALVMAAGLWTMWFIAPQLTSSGVKEKIQDRVRKPGSEQPLVQSGATALVDMHEFMANEKKSTTTYEWTDRKKGFVRIPIDEAMKKVATAGLPVRSNPARPEDVK